jgi:membrane associated rhomboid family serine protease
MNPTQLALRRFWRRTSRYRPHTMTGAIVVVTVLAYLIELLSPITIENALGYAAVYTIPSTGAPFEPWRMLTALLVHLPITGGGSIVNITHIGFNMYALYLFGRPLENVIGGRRLLAIYLISGFGGSVAVLYASLTGFLGSSAQLFVIGASGAVFGVLAATIVIQRRFGLDVRALLILVAINLALDFVLRGISWQAHIGGLIVGAAAGWIVVRNRGPRRVRRVALGLGGLSAALIVLTLIPAVVV